ncbi:MAG TPA: hypothetical protein VNB49_07900, partial [Candidatus Dormibacteraeota bacterium]|nr:hypothetical protein [Candidatus Dormibacteraeota bacterium]
PVIVTEQCGIASLLANEAGLVVRHEVRDLAKALACVLTDNILRGHLRAGCAKVAMNLGWGSPVQEMERLYSKFASRKTGQGETKEAE